MATGGDSISPEAVNTTATIACFARTNKSNAAVALTAMHLVADAGLTPSTSLRFVSPGIGRTASALLGTLFRGTTDGTDAAAILLADGVLPAPHIHGIHPVLGCRAPTERDRFKPVRLFGAGSGRVLHGRVESIPIAIPELGLDEALLVSIASVPGDSGAAVVAKDGYVLGLLKGRYAGSNGLAVVPTITSALAALRCHAD